MHRAALADEAGSKLLEDLVRTRQYPPEAVGVFRVVGSVFCIPLEGDGVGNFARHRPDLHLDPERCQTFHELPVKIGDRSRCQRHYSFPALAGLNKQLVMDEIEFNLEDLTVVWNGRSCESEGRNVEGHFPPMIEPCTGRPAVFSRELGPPQEGCLWVIPSLHPPLRSRAGGYGLDVHGRL